MKDLGDASVVLGIPIFRDMTPGVLRLSQKGYIEKKSLSDLICILDPPCIAAIKIGRQYTL